MKTSSKRIKVLTILATLMFVLTCLSFVFTNKSVKAEGKFQMLDGAGIRISEENSGIRFISEVNDTSKDYYILIVPTDYLLTKNITSDYVEELERNYPTQEFAKLHCTPFNYEGKTVISGALVELKDANYIRDFTGIAYYVEDNVYHYASFNDGVDIISNARSIATVASACLEDGEIDNKEFMESIIDKAFQADNDGEFGFEKDSQELFTNESINVKLNSSFNLKVSYSSSNEEVATVDANGIVTAVSKGNATVTAKIGSGDKYSDSISIEVKEVPSNTWINTDSPIYAQNRDGVTYLDTFDGENGVLKIEHIGEGAVIGINLALPVSSYEGFDRVVIKAKGNPGTTAYLGCSDPFAVANGPMALTDEWKYYEFDITTLIGSATLQQFSDNGMIWFNGNTSYLYIAEAFVYDLPENTWINTYSQAYAQDRNGVTYLDTFDGENGVLKIEHPGEGAVTGINLALPVSSYEGFNRVVIKAKGNPGTMAYLGCENPWYLGGGAMALTDEWKYYEFDIPTLIGSATLEQFSNKGIIYFNGNTSYLYIAEAFVYDLPENTWINTYSQAYAQDRIDITYLDTFDGENGVLKIEHIGEGAVNGINLALPVSSYEGFDRVVIRAKGNPGTTAYLGCSDPFKILPSMALTDEWVDYEFKISDLLKDGLTIEQLSNKGMIWFNGNTSYLYIAEAYAYKFVLPEKTSVFNFNDPSIVSGSNGNVTYDSTEQAVKIVGNGFYWLLRGKMEDLDLLSQYDFITFKVKADSPCYIDFYDENSGTMHGQGYEFNITSTTEYQEFTFSIDNLITYYTGLNSYFEAYIENNSGAIYIKDIYVTKKPDKLSLFDFTNKAYVGGQVSWDETEQAVKVDGNGGDWQFIPQLRNGGFIINKDLAAKYSKIVFKIKTDSAKSEQIWIFGESAGSGSGYNFSVESGDYAEYEFDIASLLNTYDSFNSQFEILLNGSTCNFFIKEIYVK